MICIDNSTANSGLHKWQGLGKSGKYAGVIKFGYICLVSGRSCHLKTSRGTSVCEKTYFFLKF